MLILSLRLSRDSCAPNYSTKLSFMADKSLSFPREKIFLAKGNLNPPDFKRSSILITEAIEMVRQ